MAKVTIPKTEFDKLERQAKAYRTVASAFFESVLREESIDDVVADFRQTGLYEEEFLKDLEQGLMKSSFGPPNDNQAPTL